MIPRLILVEGLPGCGKSTTAQFIAIQLRRSGRAARWYYEEETPHPILKGRFPGATWEGYIEDRLARWAEFATFVNASDEIHIVESTLFQTPIMTMLREDAATTTILDFLQRLQESLRPLPPLLLYLRHPDSGAALRTIFARRGSHWEDHHVRVLADSAYGQARGAAGVPGLLAYWREHAALMERAVTSSPLATLVLDVTSQTRLARRTRCGSPSHDGDWTERRQRIADHLAISLTDDPRVDESPLRALEGRYRGGATKTRECTIAPKDGRPVVNGMLWPDNPLLPKGTDLFEAGVVAVRAAIRA